MKKILFGSASAILSVVGLSAFKTAKTLGTSYYWFSVKSEIFQEGPAKLNNGSVSAILISPGKAIFGTSSVIPLSYVDTCPSTPYECIVGFTFSQLTSGLAHLKISPAKLFQTPQSVPYQKS